MSDCTVSVVTPSKTVALPTARVAFATTTNPAMRATLAHFRTVFSFGRVPQCGELTGVAALCLTPQAWIDAWNSEYRRRLGVLRAGLRAVNSELGCEVYQVPPPQGGWYFTLRVARHLFPADVTSSVHAAVVLAHYDQDCHDSGLAMLPGELFGHGLPGCPEPWLTLRGSLAVDEDTLRICVERLRDAALRLRGPDGSTAVRHALYTSERAMSSAALAAATVSTACRVQPWSRNRRAGPDSAKPASRKGVSWAVLNSDALVT